MAVLADLLRAAGHDPVVLRGGMGAGQRRSALERLRPDAGPLLVVATGPHVGDGFDRPVLDNRVRQALTALAEQQAGDDHVVGEAERQLAECDRKLASHRAALEAGVDPALIAAWTADVQRRRDAISARLQARSTPHSTRMRPAQIVDLVSALGGMLAVLRRAEAADNCEVYRQLGLSVVYRHEDRTALAQVRPRIPVGVMDVSEGGPAH